MGPGAGEHRPRRHVVRRVQILERTVPADGDALQRYLAEARDRTLSAGVTPAALIRGAARRRRLRHAGPRAVHRAPGRRAQGSARAGRAGARAPRRPADDRLLRPSCASSRRSPSRLDPADVVVEGVLAPRMLARAIRLAFDPYGRERVEPARRRAGAEPACDTGQLRAARLRPRVGPLPDRQRGPPHVLGRAVAAAAGRADVPRAAAALGRRRALAVGRARAGQPRARTARGRGGHHVRPRRRGHPRRARLPHDGTPPQAQRRRRSSASRSWRPDTRSSGSPRT